MHTMSITDTAPACRDSAARHTLRRVLFTALGLAFTGVAILGTLLPGIPSLMPLLVAVFFLARGNPPLERRIRRLRILQPVFRMIEPGRPFPRRARYASLAMMWLSVGVSAALTARSLHPIVPTAILATGLVGTVCIWRFRREPSASLAGQS